MFFEEKGNEQCTIHGFWMLILLVWCNNFMVKIWNLLCSCVFNLSTFCWYQNVMVRLADVYSNFATWFCSDRAIGTWNWKWLKGLHSSALLRWLNDKWTTWEYLTDLFMEQLWSILICKRYHVALLRGIQVFTRFCIALLWHWYK
jgi:hypothetical protein